MLRDSVSRSLAALGYECRVNMSLRHGESEQRHISKLPGQTVHPGCKMLRTITQTFECFIYNEMA